MTATTSGSGGDAALAPRATSGDSGEGDGSSARHTEESVSMSGFVLGNGLLMVAPLIETTMKKCVSVPCSVTVLRTRELAFVPSLHQTHDLFEARAGEKKERKKRVPSARAGGEADQPAACVRPTSCTCGDRPARPDRCPWGGSRPPDGHPWCGVARARLSSFFLSFFLSKHHTRDTT